MRWLSSSSGASPVSAIGAVHDLGNLLRSSATLQHAGWYEMT